MSTPVMPIVDADRLLCVRKDIARLHELRARECSQGRAEFELIELEDRLGHYVDILEQLVGHE